MSISVIILVVVVFIIFFIAYSRPKVITVMDDFIRQQNQIFDNINKWMQKDVGYALESIIKPMNTKCVKKSHTMESLQELRTENISEFIHLLECGYIHNLFVLTALDIWENFSSKHTEDALNLFIDKLIIPVTQADYFNRLDYLQLKTKIQERMIEYGV